MKYSNLSNMLKATVVTVGLTVMTAVAPAIAQTTDGTGTTGTDTTTVPGTTEEVGNDAGFDWGWLGLIGLAGLAGLAGRKDEPVRYNDPEVTSRTTNRY